MVSAFLFCILILLVLILAKQADSGHDLKVIRMKLSQLTDVTAAVASDVKTLVSSIPNGGTGSSDPDVPQGVVDNLNAIRTAVLEGQARVAGTFDAANPPIDPNPLV